MTACQFPKASSVCDQDGDVALIYAFSISGPDQGRTVRGYEETQSLVLDEAIPKSTNDFSLSSISHPKVVKQMDEFLVKEKRNRFEAQSQAHDS